MEFSQAWLIVSVHWDSSVLSFTAKSVPFFFLRGWGERWNSSLFGISIQCLIISISGV